MPQFTLTYFNGTGLGEIVRLIFAAANQQYTNQFMDATTLPALKPTLLFGQLPLLTVVEDSGAEFKLVQSTAISRYLANRFHLSGSTCEEHALVDQWVDGVIDLRVEFVKAFRSTPETKDALMKEFLETKLPEALKRFDGGVSSGHLVGNSLSWADLYLYNWISEFEFLKPLDAAAFPHLAKFKHDIVEANASLKKYVTSTDRPQSFLDPSRPKTN